LINEFGYMTIPTLALTGFALTFAFLLFAVFDTREAGGDGGSRSTLESDD
jgi:hypothetical protein